jgi:multidrug efflux system membrane fusion protein
MDTPVIIQAFGNTEDRMSVDVAPQISGTLLATWIQDGAVVTNGQPLFQIDPSDYAARVRQVEGLVAADKANLNLSRITLERSRPLLDKELISRESFDILQARVDAAAAQLGADEAALDQAKLSLSRCTVYSPLDGVCSKRLVDDGNLVAAGLTRLINIRSYDPLIVECSLSEKYLGEIRQAMAAGPVPIEVTPRNGTNSFPGVLDFMDNTVSPATGTVTLRGKVPNKDLKLWAGQFVEIRITAGVVRDAIMIPDGAVQFGKRGAQLYVATQEGKAELRMVKTGIRHNNMLQIVEGVAAEENVVVLGQLMLFPGAAVMDLAQKIPGAAQPATNPHNNK